MIDIQFVRDNPELVQEKSRQKNVEIDIDQLLGFDRQWRELLQLVEDKRRERNEHASSFQKSGGKPTEQGLQKGKQIKEQLVDLEHKLDAIYLQLNNLLKQVPNMPLEGVPVGASEDENVVAEIVGEPKQLDFAPKSHVEIGEAKGWIDKERAAKVAGARFAYLKGDLVRLEMALMQFGIDRLGDQSFIKRVIDKYGLNISDKPFVPVLPPAVARTEVYEATARLDKSETTYKLAEDDLWLNASAEHTLVPMHQGETLNKNELPLRYVGYTTAFRREAGSYGKDVEGIIRLHQFNKLEMESFSSEIIGLEEHKLFVALQRELMEELEIPYRLVQKCTADIGSPNASGWDIDSWMAGQGAYRETHTADYMTDYQARRLKTKYKDEEGNTRLVHTNDATVFSERPLIAIVENNQTKEGDVIVPEVLKKYLNKEVI